MRVNRRGMLALMDAMLFAAVIMVAAAVTVGYAYEPASDDRDAGDLLDGLTSSTVRMSDLVEGGDGSLVRTSDLMALHVSGGAEGAGEYLEELMESYSAGRHYRLTMTFGDLERTLGDGSGAPSVSAERTVPVTTGGDLTVRLELFPS